MGVGLQLEKKRKKIILASAIESSPAYQASVMNKIFDGDIQLIRVINRSRGISLSVGKKTTINQVLNALIGEEGSDVIIQTRQKGLTGTVNQTINHYFVKGKNLSSPQEMDYLKTYFSEGMAPLEKVIDTDGDGVSNDNDDCPDEYGSKANGCPNENTTDTDGDGVPDNLDLCVDQIGTAANFGCPEKGEKVSAPTEEETLFCQNLRKIVEDFSDGFWSIRESEYRDTEDPVEKRWGLKYPLPGLMKQYFYLPLLSNKLEFKFYMGLYAKGLSLDQAKIKYSELMALARLCQIKKGKLELKESSYLGAPTTTWLISDPLNELEEFYDRFIMEVTVNMNYDPAKKIKDQTYDVFLRISVKQ